MSGLSIEEKIECLNPNDGLATSCLCYPRKRKRERPASVKAPTKMRMHPSALVKSRTLRGHLKKWPNRNKEEP